MNTIEVMKNFLEEKEVFANNCWTINKYKNGNGYRRYRKKENGKFTGFYLHIESYKMHKGEIAEGLVVRHICHNRACFNPEHLDIGTPKQNSEDTVKANKQAKGTKIAQSKLNEEQVLEIRKLYSEGMTQIELGKMFDVNASNIWAIVHGKTWGWL